MARTTVVTVTDDLDGSQAADTIRFALDGSRYDIDLSKENELKLRETLQPYIDVARTVNGAPEALRRPRHTSDTDSEAAAARSWAVANGNKVSSRGRVSRDVIARYQAFLSSPAPEPEPKRGRRRSKKD